MLWRRFSFLALLMAFLIHISLIPAFGLRCKNRIVSIGETPLDVLEKCGRPNHVDHWEEGHNTYFSQLYDYEKERYVAPKSIKGPLQLERWTYDFGPHKFIRYLLFINGKLIKIETGEKGND